MHIFLFVAGVGWIAWSIPIFGLAKGGIHEVYGAIMLSFGVLFLGLAELLRRLKDIVPRVRADAVSQVPAHTAADDYWRPSQAAQDFINSGR